ncbi:MAG: cupin domain-containing protein [Rhodanobacteraceae bacterium]|nr:cupin domain-containing protein [Rhodanobacteraceae bacterium]
MQRRAPVSTTALPIEVHARASQPLGMPAARFLRDYWQKHPLLIRGAFANFKNPVEPNDLAGLACEELALARIVIEKKARAAQSQWELRTGPFAEADFGKLPKTHWTLLVQDVDKWDADVAALLGHFAFLPSWRIDDVMISYAEDGGSVGAHVDQYDVFLLQGLGQRRWEIDGNPHAPKAFRDDVELKLLREFTPTHEWVLEPGDMLYLPPGVPHHGVALGACMTYSVGMRAPSQGELLGDFVDHLAEALPEEARYGDADLEPARQAGEIDDAAIERVTAALPWLRFATDGSAPGGVDPAALRTWFGQFITRYRSAHAAQPNPRPLTDAAFTRALAQDARVRRNPWSRVAWLREGRGARLFVAGEAHACSLRLAQLVGAEAEFALTDAPAAARDHAVLRALVDAGHFALLRPRGRGRAA